MVAFNRRTGLHGLLFAVVLFFFFGCGGSGGADSLAKGGIGGPGITVSAVSVAMSWSERPGRSVGNPLATYVNKKSDSLSRASRLSSRGSFKT